MGVEFDGPSRAEIIMVEEENNAETNFQKVEMIANLFKHVSNTTKDRGIIE
ncbi:unnamed protein product [Dovyalis caffra]|uniref:Uncharacterized protein n=1 Tax=Dovyalis caffra TaxID=77055 RepID=A0AAV1QV61_9ROSI|nr:unnamed protein product [Dovyalis caffra]